MRWHAEPSQARYRLLLAWLVACVAMGFSLVFSEARGWLPCSLCWYQRICLWPLIPVLGLALHRQRLEVASYVFPQSVVGLLLAGYQVVIQDFVGDDFLGICRSGPDCAQKVSLGLGPVSIPMFSLAAFAIIAFLLHSIHRHRSSRLDSS